MADLLCSFDIGTSGVKGGILTPDGKILHTAHLEYDIINSQPGWIEQSIDQMWEGQCEVSQALFSQSPVSPKDIAAVSVSCQRATFVPVDKDERPLMNFISWQDQRSTCQCDEIKHKVGENKYYEISGLAIEPTAAISKILWLKKYHPEIIDKPYKFASTQNIHLCQLGIRNSPCDLPDAAYFGLLDVNELEWSCELLEILDISPERLPSLVPSGTVVGEVSTKAAKETGLAEGTPVVTAGGDLQCASLGAGVSEPGVVSIMIGTGSDVVTFLPKPIKHPDMAMNCLPHVVPGAWEMEAMGLASGGVYKWFRYELCSNVKHIADLTGEDAYNFLNLAASQAPPGSCGVIVIPTFMGSGVPNRCPRASGVILGLDLATNNKILARAMLEGICLEIRWMLEATKKKDVDVNEVRICGGASKSPLWHQISADIYGVPTARTEIAEAGLVGASICSAIGIGLFKNATEGVQAMVRIAEVCEPNPKLINLYDEMYEIFKTAYKELEKGAIFERLDSFRKNISRAQ